MKNALHDLTLLSKWKNEENVKFQATGPIISLAEKSSSMKILATEQTCPFRVIIIIVVLNKIT